MDRDARRAGRRRRRGARPDDLREGARRQAPMLVVWIPVDEARDFLERGAAAGLPPPAEASRERDEDEWRDVWKQYFAPRKVGRFVIVPSWEKYAADAGRGGARHGSGARLRHRRPSVDAAVPGGDLASSTRCERFLDVGCGSGVLAIACAQAVRRGERHRASTSMPTRSTSHVRTRAQRGRSSASRLDDAGRGGARAVRRGAGQHPARRAVPLAGPIAARLGAGRHAGPERHPARARRRRRGGLSSSGAAHGGAARRRGLARARDDARERS